MPRSAVAGSKDPWSIQVTADITCQRRWWPGLSDIPSAAGASTWGSTLMGTKCTGAKRACCHCWSEAESPFASACPMLRHAKREPTDLGERRQAVIGDRDGNRQCHSSYPCCVGEEDTVPRARQLALSGRRHITNAKPAHTCIACPFLANITCLAALLARAHAGPLKRYVMGY